MESNGLKRSGGSTIKQYLLLFLIFLLIPTVSADLPKPNIDGDRAYIDDENAYFSVTPHTLNRSGWVNVTLNSKQFSGDIDLLFGFNSLEGTPRTPQLYKPRWVDVPKEYTCEYEFNYTIFPHYFWCYQTYQVNIGTNETPIMENRTNMVFEREFYIGNLPQKTAYWTEQEFKVWKDVGALFKETDRTFNNKDTWYIGKNLNVNQSQEYTIRFYMDTRINTQGEYDIGIKRSSQSLQQAIDTGTLYAIDPWWDLSFPYRQEIHATSTLTNLPIAVNGSDGVCGHMIYTDNNATGETIYLYYINSGDPCADEIAIGNETHEKNWENATDLTGNNPTSVWNDTDIIGIWHFDDGDLFQDSTPNNNDGLSPNTTETNASLTHMGDNVYLENGEWISFGNLEMGGDFTALIYYAPPKRETSSCMMILKADQAGWAGTYTEYRIMWDSAGAGKTTYETVNGNNVVGTTDWDEGGRLNEFYRFGMVYNTSTIVGGLNDSIEKVGAAQTLLHSTQNDTLSVEDFHLGQDYSCSGTYDEYMLWNRSLSTEERTHIWNMSTSSLGAEETANLPPTVSLAFPSDGQVITTTKTPDMQFYVNDTDAGDVLQATVYIDNTSCGTNLSVTNVTLTTITSTCTLQSGNHQWYVQANDSSTPVNSSPRNFTIDAEPILNITFPINGSIINTSYVIELNVTSNKTVDSWWFQVNGNGTNITFATGGASANTTLNLTSLGEGLKNITVWANITLWEGDTTVYFTFNTIEPSFTLISPPNNSYTTNDTIYIYTEAAETTEYFFFFNGTFNDTNANGDFSILHNAPNGTATWYVLTSDGLINVSTGNRTINRLYDPDNCPPGTANEIKVYQFQVIDEKSLENKTSAEFIGATITVTAGNQIYNFSISNTSNASLGLCFDDAYLGASLDIDVIFHNGSVWPVGNWYIRDHTITTTTTFQELALLNTTYATLSYIFLEDEVGNLAKQYYFTLLIYDYNTSTWKELRMSQTDSKGKAVFYLERSTIFYSFYAYDEDMVYLQTFSNRIITDLETELALDSTAFNYLAAAYLNIDHSCTDYNTSLNCTMTDTNDPPRVTNTTLSLWYAGAVNSSLICSSSSTTNPASVSCLYDNTSTYYWYLDVSMNPDANLDGGTLGTLPQDDYGRMGVFTSGFLSVALGYVGAYNPIVFVFLLFIGFILSQFVGLVNTTDQLTLSFFATISAIVIWRLKPR